MNEKIDVQSTFNEGDLEYVSNEDSKELLNTLDGWHEYTNERNNE